jgi:UDP:flavonoid glycosyltransferase YjiC (YdhE family)
MSTIYAYTSPARGHIYPLTPILIELARRGHRVKVWTLAGECEQLRDLGLEATAIDPAIEARQMDDWQAKSPPQQLANTMATFLARAPHEVADVRGATEAEAPDLWLTDVNSYGAAAAAEAAGVAWAAFAPYFTPLPDPSVPPFGPGLRPLGGPLGRLRNRALGGLLAHGLNRKFLDRLNGIRADAEAGRLDSVLEQWTRAPRLLYLTVPELEYPRRWPESFRFVGPGNWEPPAEAPGWLEDVERPLVLLTASTEYQQDEELLSTALEALAREDVEVVATAAGCDPAHFDPPANARLERFVPHAPILARAEAVICHGGMGITQKALAAGVPVCTVGWGRDQLESGRRVEVAGAGALLPRKKLNPERLREALATARARRPGAERIASAIASSPGPSGAADELEALLPVAA